MKPSPWYPATRGPWAWKLPTGRARVPRPVKIVESPLVMGRLVGNPRYW